MEPSTGITIWRVYDFFVKTARLSAVHSSLELLSELLRNSLCSFQLRYTNYQFGASRKHLEFKKALLNKSTDTDAKFVALDEFMLHGLSTFSGELADGIQAYFLKTHLHREKPRVTVYLVDENDFLVSIAMIPGINGANDFIARVEDYTLFTEVRDKGTAYLSNNIPSTVKQEESFLHPELDVQKIRSDYSWFNGIRNLKLVARIRNNYFRKNCTDKKWSDMKCSPIAPYKSSLVVPITYRAHADKNILDAKLVSILQLKEDGRSILGFIRVDHSAAYYFDNGPVESFENIDVNVMYVYADIISLAIVTYLMYTSGSSSYNEVKGAKS